MNVDYCHSNIRYKPEDSADKTAHNDKQNAVLTTKLWYFTSEVIGSHILGRSCFYEVWTFWCKSFGYRCCIQNLNYFPLSLTPKTFVGVVFFLHLLSCHFEFVTSFYIKSAALSPFFPQALLSAVGVLIDCRNCQFSCHLFPVRLQFFLSWRAVCSLNYFWIFLSQRCSGFWTSFSQTLTNTVCI